MEAMEVSAEKVVLEVAAAATGAADMEAADMEAAAAVTEAADTVVAAAVTEAVERAGKCLRKSRILIPIDWNQATQELKYLWTIFGVSRSSSRKELYRCSLPQILLV